jgi:hypothetical protein
MRSERDNAIELAKKRKKDERKKRHAAAVKKEREGRREDRTKHRRFKKEVDAGFIPAKINFHFGGRLLEWTKPKDKINPAKFLPKFFDGLFEKEEPYQFLCQRGTLALLQRVRKEKLMADIKPTLPTLLIKMKDALETEDPTTVVFCLDVIDALLSCGFGKAMTRLYHVLVPKLTPYFWQNR